MSREYYDPWAKVGSAAQNAVIKHAVSRPSQADAALQSAEIAKLNAEGRLIEGRINAATGLANLVGDVYRETPQQPPSNNFIGAMPVAAPSPEVVNQRWAESLPQFASNAALYGIENPGDFGKILQAYTGNFGGTPDQLTNAQMGAGVDFASTEEGFYAKPENSGYTLSPGEKRLNNQNKEVAQGTPKSGGGLQFRTNPDGTVEFSEEGGLATDFGKPAQNKLDQQLILLDGVMQSINEADKALEEEENEVWKSTGITGSIGGSNVLGMAHQIPGATDVFDKVNLGEKDMTRIKVNRSKILHAASEVGRFMANGTNSEIFTDTDREIANDAITIAKAGTTGKAGRAILKNLFAIVRTRMANAQDARTRGSSAIINRNNQGNVYPNDVSQDDSFTKQNGYLVADEPTNEPTIAQSFGNAVNSPANKPDEKWGRDAQNRLVKLEGF